MTKIVEVSGLEYADTLHSLNGKSPDIFPPLKLHHLRDGFWFLIYHRDEPKAFAGMVPMHPFKLTGYLKRCWVHPEYRGRGWQKILLEERERKAKEIGWHMLVSECGISNTASANNFLRCGYQETFPEQPWARESRYFVKEI